MTSALPVQDKGLQKKRAAPCLFSESDQGSAVVAGGLFVPVQDLAARHEDHFIVLFDILENLVEVADAVGNARQVGVDGNGHDAIVFFAFFIEGVELIAGTIE